MGAALNYGWERFKNNALTWIGITVVAGLISFGINLLFGGFDFSTDGSTSVSALSIIGGLVSIVVSILIQAAYVRGALHEVDGNKPAFGSFFQFSNIGAVILASILVGFAVSDRPRPADHSGHRHRIPDLFHVAVRDRSGSGSRHRNQVERQRHLEECRPHCFYWHSRQSASTSLAHCSAVLGLLVTGPVTLIAGTYAYRVITGRFVAAL